MADLKVNNKRLEDTLNALANMDTDIVSTFNVLSDLGISISHDGWRNKDIGEVVKELDRKLKKMV